MVGIGGEPEQPAFAVGRNVGDVEHKRAVAVRGVEAIDVAALFDDIDAAVARDGGDIERLVEPRSDALHRDPLAAVGDGDVDRLRPARAGVADAELAGSSEERPVGKESVSTCSARWPT